MTAHIQWFDGHSAGEIEYAAERGNGTLIEVTLSIHAAWSTYSGIVC